MIKVKTIKESLTYIQDADAEVKIRLTHPDFPENTFNISLYHKSEMFWVLCDEESLGKKNAIRDILDAFCKRIDRIDRNG